MPRREAQRVGHDTAQLPVPDHDPHRFVFELDRAIKDQVLAVLNESPEKGLARDVAPRLSGIYVLKHQDRIVYVGKASRETTESERDLRGRLNEHLSKIEGRKNIDLADVKCMYLTIESDWFVWAAERALITSFEPDWNASGFGNKDFGRGRDQQRPSAFDERFPINEEFQTGPFEADMTVADLLRRLKAQLPFLLRFQTQGGVGEVDVRDYYRSKRMNVTQGGVGVCDILQSIVNALGDEWQATIFKSHMILYHESIGYPHSMRILRKTN